MKGLMIVAVALMMTACGGGNSNPAAPTPPPLPAANIVASGPFAFNFDDYFCTNGTSSCRLSGALQNTGAGCAANTTAVIRLSGTAGTLPDMQLGTLGAVLSARTLRPGEVVSVTTVGSISRSAALAVTTYQVLPTWTNAAC